MAKKPAQPLVSPSRLLTEPKASSSKESLSPSGNLGTHKTEEWKSAELGTAPTIVSRPSAREQVTLLEARKLQYQRAALQAKRRQDLEQAKAHLRTAKSLEAQITQARAGQPIDLSKVSPT